MLSWFPENISTYGSQIDHVINVIYYIVGVWFVIAQAVLFYFLFRYRNKGQKAAYEPGIGFKKLAWVIVPVILVLGFDLAIDVIQTPVWSHIKIDLPKNPDQRINITGKQFAWEFTHQGADNKLGTEDDIKTETDLYVPVNKKVVFELEAKDVLHSFWVPNLRLKQDAVPGRNIKGWFEATKTGSYGIGCAELCGVGHGNMKGTLHVLSQNDYAAWMKKTAEENANTDDFWD